MYTRHNNHKHVRQHNAQKNAAHCHCQYVSHSVTQKSYRKHTSPQNTRHVPHIRKACHPRNKFANVECFYCMKLGHTSNVCFYRRLHLNMLPVNYFDITNLGQERFGFKRKYDLCFVGVLEVHKNKK